jgi:hypothetical protein
LILHTLRQLVLWAAFVVVPTTTLVAQPSIDHEGLSCMRPGEFVVVLSGIDPDDVQTAKVYFRSRLFRDFYYVEMTYQDGQYVGILPQPSNETPQVVYYLEALDSAFNTARSPEYEADVEGGCRRDATAAYLPNGSVGITVGATVGGAAALPPGFTAAGIIGTIAATGIASGAGGVGAGTAIAIGAAAAAAGGAGLAVLTTGPDGGATTSLIAATPTTTAAATSTAPSGSTTSAGAGPSPPTTIPGTTSVPAGPTTTSVGGETTTTIPSPSTTPGTTTSPVALDASCFTVTVLGVCRVRVDAGCVALSVDEYEWILDLNNRYRKEEIPNGPVSLEHAWSGADCSGNQTIRFRLKVRREGLTSTAHKNLLVPSNLTATPTAPIRVGIRAHLVGSGSIGGRVVVNETLTRAIDPSGPVDFSLQSRLGANTLTGIIESASGEPATWRFELTGVAPGSLRVVSGNVVSSAPTAVVFRVDGTVGERVELTFVPFE